MLDIQAVGGTYYNFPFPAEQYPPLQVVNFNISISLLITTNSLPLKINGEYFSKTLYSKMKNPSFMFIGSGIPYKSTEITFNNIIFTQFTFPILFIEPQSNLKSPSYFNINNVSFINSKILTSLFYFSQVYSVPANYPYPNFYISNSIFNNILMENSASISKAFIINCYQVNLVISNSTFSNNKVSSIYAHLSNINISDSTITANNPDSSNPQLTTFSSIVNISNSTFSYNLKFGSHSTYQDIIYINNVQYISNQNNIENGGALSIGNSTCYITNSIFLNNTALFMNGGGAISFFYSNGTITNTTFIDNSANEGVLYIFQSNVSIFDSFHHYSANMNPYRFSNIYQPSIVYVVYNSIFEATNLQ